MEKEREPVYTARGRDLLKDGAIVETYEREWIAEDEAAMANERLAKAEEERG